MPETKRIFEAYLDEMNVITILVPLSYQESIIHSFSLHRESHSWYLEVISCDELDGFRKYTCKANAFIEIGQLYIITDDQGTETDLQIGAVIRTDLFDEAFEYTGNDLGVTYSVSSTIFKVWAPTAAFVQVLLFYPRINHNETHEMVRQSNGVWLIEIQGDLEGVHYKFNVCVNQVWRDAVDPYATAVTVNGENGVIIDIEKTRNEKVELPVLAQPTDAIIYETHIRDFSIHPESGIKHKGKFLGLAEKNTRGIDSTLTGLSYLLELGVTHIELLPFNDYEEVDEIHPLKSYNWGYNPVYFNVPEGSYATDPTDPYCRIKELKLAIKALHEKGLRVIMDVVFNHVYIREDSPFEKIVPGYYFRHDEHGMPSNGTGVGNDVGSERKMVRKFIIDSVLFWLKEYHIDGFRFDLMGILDIDTMNAIRRAVDEIDSSIIMLGEGWDLNTPLANDKKATISNAGKLPRIAQFNDRFRDGVKGSTFNLYDRGFTLGNMHKGYELKQSIAGSISLAKGEKGLFIEPSQSINYVESHDNHTLWDKMLLCNSGEGYEIRKKRQRLATTIVLLSQGIPFLHSGQEFFRTKQGVENSYNSPDTINRLDWQLKNDNMEEVKFVEGIIKIRKLHGAFRFSQAPLVRKHLRFYDNPDGIIVYTLQQVKEYGPWNNIMVIHSNLLSDIEVHLPEQLQQRWDVICDGKIAGIQPLYSLEKKQVTIPAISTIILCQK